MKQQITGKRKQFGENQNYSRDELLSKNNILTSQLQDQKTNESLVELNNVLSKRVELLTEERLETIVGTHQGQANSKIYRNKIDSQD